MAEETTQGPPDLEKVPKFDALTAWIGKLEAWCKAAADEVNDLRNREDKLQGHLNEANAKIADLEAEAEDYGRLVDDIADYGRGIITREELFDKAGVTT